MKVSELNRRTLILLQFLSPIELIAVRITEQLFRATNTEPISTMNGRLKKQFTDPIAVRITERALTLAICKFLGNHGIFFSIVNRVLWLRNRPPKRWVSLSTKLELLICSHFQFWLAHQVKSQAQKEHFCYFQFWAVFWKMFLNIFNSSDCADCLEFNIFFVSKTFWMEKQSHFISAKC